MFGERECHPMSKKANPAALLPILVFLVLYLGLGLIFEYVLKIPMGFYSIPIVVIFLIALLVACCQNRALSFDEKLTLMGHGVGDKNIITMLLIFLAAGMFVGVVGRSSAESVAYFMLSIIPSKFAVAVLFVVSCFVSTAMGTSVGTITLIVPIAIPIAAASGYSLPLCVASVMGGAMFGDNLSFISDTTIAACNGQGCAMKDKFRENFHIAFPAALASLALILVLTLHADVTPAEIPPYNLIQIIPYMLVLIGGIIGINVFIVLLIGIVSGAVIALATGATGQTGILAVKALLGQGIPYLATNPDWVCPTAYGFVPDCGSVCEMLWRATSRRPIVIGKPEPLMPQLAMLEASVSAQETLLVGDRIYTDIASGANAGIDTLLVLSGETKEEDLPTADPQPTFVLPDVAALLNILES